MSIFSDHISNSGDKIVEQYYNIVWDYIHGKKIIARLSPKKREDGIFYVNPDHKHTYYNPDWIFYVYLDKALRTSKFNARPPKKNKGGCKGSIVFNKLDESNIRFRFNKIIEQCEVLKYNGNTYIFTDPYDNTTYSRRNTIINMMYNYITKETSNSKYFKK